MNEFFSTLVSPCTHRVTVRTFILGSTKVEKVLFLCVTKDFFTCKRFRKQIYLTWACLGSVAHEGFSEPSLCNCLNLAPKSLFILLLVIFHFSYTRDQIKLTRTNFIPVTWGNKNQTTRHLINNVRENNFETRAEAIRTEMARGACLWIQHLGDWSRKNLSLRPGWAT